MFFSEQHSILVRCDCLYSVSLRSLPFLSLAIARLNGRNRVPFILNLENFSCRSD